MDESVFTCAGLALALLDGLETAQARRSRAAQLVELASVSTTSLFSAHITLYCSLPTGV